LIYRLSAAGHRVQLWAAPLRQPYRALATYLNVNVLDLSQVISELEITASNTGTSQSAAASRSRRETTGGHGGSAGSGRRTSPFRPQRLKPPLGLSYTGEEQLYQAIAETLDAHEFCEAGAGPDRARVNRFRSILADRLGARLAGVGYGVGSRVAYWLEHLL